MQRAIIFANGEITPPYPSRADFQPDDWFIAADGGAIHFARLGITPHTLVGDFDSLTSVEVDRMAHQGVQIIRHPAHKDETDLELALLHAVKRDVRQIIVYGALGARWDMTIANLMLLAHPALQHTQLSLIDGNQQISLLRGGQTLQLQSKRGDTVSFIPLSPEARGITTSGLEYPLHNGILTQGSPRGVSNVVIDEPCQVVMEEGMLVVVHIRQVSS